MPHYSHEHRRLFYRERGSGPLLLVLPGSTASSAHHLAEMAHFSDRFRVVCLDFWGTGQSDRISGPWPDNWWRICAEDAGALAAHLGCDRFCTMGCSGGAIVALETAILLPDRVSAVIADSCVERFSAASMKIEVQNRSAASPEMEAFWQYGHGKDWQEVVAADGELLLRFVAQGGDWAKGRLGNVSCPVLITASMADESLDDVVDQVVGMARQMENSFVFLSPTGDHPLMWSRSAAFRAAADVFLDKMQNNGEWLGLC